MILERLHGDRRHDASSRRRSAIFGDGPTRIVVDPIDGSLNAKRGIPFFSVSIAVAEGDTMDDVVFGYVYDFGSGEEWIAERGKGALLERRRPRADLPEGGDRDPLLRGDPDLERRREGRRDGRPRLPPADHGLARALALPPRRGPRRRGLLAQGRRARSTSPPRSCSCASAAWRSTCPRRRRSARRRSTSRAARAVVAAATPEVCERLFAALVGVKPRSVSAARAGTTSTGGTASSTRQRCLPRRWLDFYARQFDTVEVNATFYRLPRADRGRELGQPSRRRGSSSR